MVKNTVYAIRGAITVEENTVEAIETASIEIVKVLRAKNKIADHEFISFTASTTADITKAYPVTFIRQSPHIPSTVPFFSTQEPQIEGSLPLCIRIVVLIQKLQNPGEIYLPVHFYLRGAKVLRPDLAGG